MKLLVIAFIALAFLYLVGDSVSSDNEEPGEMERPNIEFTVTKDESDAYKRSVEVLLNERVDEKQLEAIAEYLYEDRDGNTFIGYHLDGEGDYAYWATSHYNPDLNVRIMGSTQDEQAEMAGHGIEEQEGLIGRWNVSRGYNSVITFYEKDGQKRISQKFQDGSEMDLELYEQEVNGDIRYSDDTGKDIGEYFVIGDNGKLQFWSENGNYYTAPIDS